MATKRGNSEGTIGQLPSGSWRAQVSLQGRRLSITAKTRRECQEWIKKTTRQIDDGLTYANTKITVAEYMSTWLTNVKVANRQSTYSQYEQISRIYIIPNLGKIRLKDLRADRIQDLYNQLLGNEVGVPTVLKLHTILHGALEQAVKTGVIQQNPSSHVKPPREPETEMAILNESQVSQLLIAVKDHRWEALFHLAIVTGMRQMELLGLKWSDLDWQRRAIRVERQLSRVKGDGVRFSAPKTRFGKRAVALGEVSIDILRAHYQKQQILEQAAGDKWTEHGLIFTSSFGAPINYRNLLREFKKLLEAAGLPDIRFHDLRHTAASLMLNNGVAPIVVSRRLGHAKASITLDIYGHLIPSMQEEAADLIDNLVTPIPVEPIRQKPLAEVNIRTPDTM